MNSAIKSPSASFPNKSTSAIEKKDGLPTPDTAGDPLPQLHLEEVFLVSLLEPSPFDPPAISKKVQEQTQAKGDESPKMTLENYFETQRSVGSQNTDNVWNTGYFFDLSAGIGDLWKDRSVWASHPNIFAWRQKREAEKQAMERAEAGHSCSVLFWGW